MRADPRRARRGTEARRVIAAFGPRIFMSQMATLQPRRMDQMYDALKLLHLLGVVVLVGNVTITAFWKVFADLTKKPEVIAHATRGVIVADWIFTLLGIAFLTIGGFGAAHVGGLPVFGLDWLVIGEALFVTSGLLWIGILVPLQIKQDRAVRGLKAGDAIPTIYWRHARAWLIWGIIATLPLVAAIYVMIVKI